MQIEPLDLNVEWCFPGIQWFGSSMLLLKGTHGQIASYAPAQLLFNALSAVEIQDNREKDFLIMKLDISDIQNPRLVKPCDFSAYLIRHIHQFYIVYCATIPLNIWSYPRWVMLSGTRRHVGIRL
jgi:hypothetical protein